MRPSDEVEVFATKRGTRSDVSEVRIEVVEHSSGVTICPRRAPRGFAAVCTFTYAPPVRMAETTESATVTLSCTNIPAKPAAVGGPLKSRTRIGRLFSGPANGAV